MKKKVNKTIIHVLLILFAVVQIYPLIWLASFSLSAVMWPDCQGTGNLKIMSVHLHRQRYWIILLTVFL